MCTELVTPVSMGVKCDLSLVGERRLRFGNRGLRGLFGFKVEVVIDKTTGKIT
jgi:hypothetical protein